MKGRAFRACPELVEGRAVSSRTRSALAANKNPPRLSHGGLFRPASVRPFFFLAFGLWLFMLFALARWLRLVLLRRPGRGCGVLLRRRLGRTVSLSRLLLWRLRTRRRSSVLRRLRRRSIVHLRRRSLVLCGLRRRSSALLRRRSWPVVFRRGRSRWRSAVSGRFCSLAIVYRGVGPLRRNIMSGRLWHRSAPGRGSRTLLVRTRSRGRLARSVVRMRRVLRRSRLLVVLRRTRNVVLRRTGCILWRPRRLIVMRSRRVVGVRGLRRRVRLGQTGVHCIRRTQSSRLRGSHDCGLSLVVRYKLGWILSCCLLVLHLRRGRGYVTPTLGRHLRLRWLRLNSTRTSVIGNAIDGNVVDRLVIDMHVGNVHVVDGAVVVEITALPVSAVIAASGIAESIINAAIEADGRTPVAGVPTVEAGREYPPARRPQVTWLRSRHPRSGHPVVVV